MHKWGFRYYISYCNALYFYPATVTCCLQDGCYDNSMRYNGTLSKLKSMTCQKTNKLKKKN